MCNRVHYAHTHTFGEKIGCGFLSSLCRCHRTRFRLRSQSTRSASLWVWNATNHLKVYSERRRGTFEGFEKTSKAGVNVEREIQPQLDTRVLQRKANRNRCLRALLSSAVAVRNLRPQDSLQHRAGRNPSVVRLDIPVRFDFD